MVLYQFKNTVHLAIVSAVSAVTIAILWHFGINEISLSLSSGSRITGVGCLIFGGLHCLSSPSERKVSKGTKLITPKQFKSKFREADGIGITYLDGRNRPGLLKIQSELERSHFLICGDTGTGKSAIQHTLIQQIRNRRHDAAVIYDPSLEFWEHHASQKDLLLHPYSADCPFWDISREIRSRLDAVAIASSFIPSKPNGQDSFFVDSPRKILVMLLMELKRQGLGIPELVKWLGDSELILDMAENSDAEKLIDRDAHSQTAGVLGSLSLIADALKLLPHDDGKRAKFSFTDWANSDRQQWLFIGTRGVGEREGLRPIITAWLDIAFSRLMAVKNSHPTWCFTDELPTLRKLESFKTALHEGRKYNLRIVAGFQGKSQIESLYGRDAESLMSAPSTRVFLKSNQFSSAVWTAQNIGMPELKRDVSSYSSTVLGSTGRDSVSVRTETKSEYLVLPNEIQNLDKLTGYLRYDKYAVFVRFPYPELEQRNSFEGVDLNL